MKKMIMTIAAVLTLSVTYAAPSEKNVNNESMEIDVKVENLGRTLQLDWEQQDAVDEVHRMYNNKVQKASDIVDNTKKQKALKRAVYFNLANMRQVLNDAQYRKYLLLLNTTLKNRGVEIK